MLESSKTSEMARLSGSSDARVDSLRGAMDSAAHGGTDVVEVLLILAQRKKTILQVTLAAAVVTAIIVFLIPNSYTAKATIIPAQEKQSSLSAMIGQLGSIAGLNESDLGLKDPEDLFKGMLHSRTVQDRLIDQFDLRKVYNVKRYEDARKKLDARSDIVVDKEGMISIAVEDRDPNRAAALANGYVDQLHTLNSQLAISVAGQRRIFYEEKVAAEREALAQSEVSLKQAQEKTGLLQPDAQARVIIQSVADMKAQVALREVQIQAMRTYATKDNPELRVAEQELAGLRAQLAKMERNSPASLTGDIDVPTRKLPQAELEYLRRARDLKYHEALYEFLSKQLEAARIDEAKDAIAVQVVDKAVVPERKSGPHRVTTILVVAFVAFVLACLGIVSSEMLKRRSESDSHVSARLALLRHYLSLS